MANHDHLVQRIESLSVDRILVPARPRLRGLGRGKPIFKGRLGEQNGSLPGAGNAAYSLKNDVL
jgi:hypothetical protein